MWDKPNCPSASESALPTRERFGAVERGSPIANPRAGNDVPQKLCGIGLSVCRVRTPADTFCWPQIKRPDEPGRCKTRVSAPRSSGEFQSFSSCAPAKPGSMRLSWATGSTTFSVRARGTGIGDGELDALDARRCVECRGGQSESEGIASELHLSALIIVRGCAADAGCGVHRRRPGARKNAPRNGVGPEGTPAWKATLRSGRFAHWNGNCSFVGYDRHKEMPSSRLPLPCGGGQRLLQPVLRRCGEQDGDLL